MFIAAYVSIAEKETVYPVSDTAEMDLKIHCNGFFNKYSHHFLVKIYTEMGKKFMALIINHKVVSEYVVS